jgi:redox-sensitive bicupin YhaK (pirin superfamily)
MITVKKSEDRNYVDVKDQKTWKTFDHENKTDPSKKNFGVLNILNEEILSPGGGFILKAEKDLVVVTYVREGVIIYKTPFVEPNTIEQKQFERDNADKGAKQYAFNTSETEEAHVFQCGFDLNACEDSCGDGDPKSKGVKKLFTHAERAGVLKMIASSDGRESSLPIQQDVEIYSTFMRDGNHIIHELKPKRSAWLQVVKGKISLNDLHLRTGDGIGLVEERSVSFTAHSPAEILLLDLCESKEETKESLKGKLQAVKSR